MDEEPALCLVCHDSLAAAVSADLETPHYPVTESCVSCHDPHAAAVPALLAAPLRELCSNCHEIGDLAESHGGQLTAGADCTSCHQPHGSDNSTMLVGAHQHTPFAEGSCSGCHLKPLGGRVRLRARRERLCEACHGDVTEPVASAGGTVHAALKGKRGRAGCLSCHDPHMAQRASLLIEEGPDLCGECHEPIVAAATAENGHYAAADDCLACHRPHASEQATLLSAPAEELCQECHDLEDDDLAGAHLGADLGKLRCTNCHTPHGSGNPSLPTREVSMSWPRTGIHPSA
jgi:predicted CXXCH cytochrome family protein